MQDRYVGDVGDFRKYGLLHSLAADLSLGVVWYLTPDEGHNADGKHIAYLNPTRKNLIKFRDRDPDLYDALTGIVHEKKRSVQSVRERGVLPTGKVFYEDRLTYVGMPSIGPSAKAARLTHRRQWVDRAVDATRECDIIFLDPDNGIECGTQRHRKTGPKHVCFDEVQPYLTRGQSIVVYHHLDRSASAPKQMRHQLVRIRAEVGGCQHMSTLLFKRYGLRAFFVIPAPGHQEFLATRIWRFLDSPWAQHFEYFSAPDGLPAL